MTQPVFAGTSKAFSTVKVYAQPTVGGPQQLLGTTVTTASGIWSLQSTVVLANGSYTVMAQAVDQSGGENAQAQLLPAGTTGPLIIDTVGPTVTNVVFARLTGSVYATFQDNLSGLAMASVLNGANYTFYKLVNGRPGQFFPSTITVVQSGGPTAPVQVRISFNGGRYIRGGQYVLTIRSGGVMDVAGNALDGEFPEHSPPETARPGGNFAAGLDALHNTVFVPRPTSSGPAWTKSPGKAKSASKGRNLLRVGTVHNGKLVVNHF